MRRLLHRAIHFHAAAEDASGEAGRGTLRASDDRKFVRVVRTADSAGGVRESATAARNVRHGRDRRARPAYFTGNSDSATSKRWPIRSRFVLR